MSSLTDSENSYLRPLAVGSVAAFLDRFYIGEESMTRNALFGVAVAGGVYASEMVTPSIMPNVPSINETLYNGKTMATRGTEIVVASGSAFALNKYLLMNDRFSDEMLLRAGVVAVSDVVGTYVAEYFAGVPLSFLQPSPSS